MFCFSLRGMRPPPCIPLPVSVFVVMIIGLKVCLGVVVSVHKNAEASYFLNLRSLALDCSSLVYIYYIFCFSLPIIICVLNEFKVHVQNVFFKFCFDLVASITDYNKMCDFIIIKN